MKPVQQRQFWRPEDHPDGSQRGDCVRACVASIFEVPYEDCKIPMGGNGTAVAEWVRSRYPGVGVSTRLLGDIDGGLAPGAWKSWPTHHYQPGFWMAAIKSPRIPARKVFGCGCASQVPGGDPECRWCHGKPEERFMHTEWGLHAVVMRNGVVVHDPNPEAEDRDPDKPVYFYSATTFVVEDPSKLLRDVEAVPA